MEYRLNTPCRAGYKRYRRQCQFLKMQFMEVIFATPVASIITLVRHAPCVSGRPGLRARWLILRSSLAEGCHQVEVPLDASAIWLICGTSSAPRKRILGQHARSGLVGVPGQRCLPERHDLQQRWQALLRPHHSFLLLLGSSLLRLHLCSFFQLFQL